jgi:hypothetical protein
MTSDEVELIDKDSGVENGQDGIHGEEEEHNDSPAEADADNDTYEEEDVVVRYHS